MVIRKRIAEKCLSDALEFLRTDKGDVAIFDATNITLERRQRIYDQAVNKHGYLCLFIESLCDDESIINSNITEVKVHGPDYKSVSDKEVAVKDFIKRIEHYKEQYVEMCEEKEGHLSYVKV